MAVRFGFFLIAVGTDNRERAYFAGHVIQSALRGDPEVDLLWVSNSNGARVRLWKVELQKLANETGLAITVTHHPPGTRKWNRIEHRMFSFISINWRGRPLLSHQVIVQLIASTFNQNRNRPHDRL